MLLEERPLHHFVRATRVDLESAFLCNSTGLMSQEFASLFGLGALLIVHYLLLIVATCANFNAESGHVPAVRV